MLSESHAAKVAKHVDTCPVCMDGLALYRLSCRHVFCYTCIKRLLWHGRARQSASCPLCRAIFWWTCDARDESDPSRIWCDIPMDAYLPLRVYRRLLRRGVDMRAVFLADSQLLDAVLASCRAQPWVMQAIRSLASAHPNLAADVRLSSAASLIAVTQENQRMAKFAVFRRIASYRRQPPLWDLVRSAAESLGMVVHCQAALDACGVNTRRLVMLDPARTTVTLTDGRSLNLIQYWVLLHVPGVADGHLPNDPNQVRDLLIATVGDVPVSAIGEPIVRSLVTVAKACAACEPLGPHERCPECLPLTRDDIIYAIKRQCDAGYMIETRDPALGIVYARQD